MKADPRGVLTGSHYIDGDFACCEGALAAGCRFIAGYPITPSTEVVERFARRAPLVDGALFIQMEDELAASIAIQGAVWAGKKAMTVTSGPGFSLMMEHIGLAAMTETPCVFVDVQRGGPSTGLPTLPSQADMMQARWGSHGDYEIIALCPNSPQESFDLTVDAFNLAEQYRVPVMLMMDECVGHMMERVVIPSADKIEVTPRRFTKLPPGEYLPFKPGEDLVPDMFKAGDGYRLHVTGLTHDFRGYPAMNPEVQEQLVHRLVNKIRLNAPKIWRYEETGVEDADVVIVTFGITSRVAVEAIDIARKKGIKVGMLRLIVVWPFPEQRIFELASQGKALVVAEMNYGQVFYEVDRSARGKAPVVLAGHGGGTVHNIEDVVKKIEEAYRCRS
ncbi:MAG: 2-oxoglutarate synthase subunit alpha [Candidatus Aminicenantes bacterium RBG_16_66_30]|nr:MAG: 2-oxoglutarate synthase subunit alpha [Candidatus Aminicenantes bacterium RBG_16_66_30]